jgi:NAD(P)-dependent dehydrogenase (short-subunit alcohol dehydrogenase family)
MPRAFRQDEGNQDGIRNNYWSKQGVGLETALEFGRAGHTVYATMRKPAASDLAQRAAREKLPITVLAMDVNSDESVRNGIASILKNGPIDVLVNNAGVAPAGSVEELPLSEFRAVMETNYFGALRTIQALLPHMRERRSGCIINVSSIAGRISNPPLTPYCATKWALEALSEGVAAEMKTFGVRVAIVQPGIIDTEMARSMEGQADHSVYRQKTRISALFEAALKNQVPPSLVAKKIVDVAESGTWQLRHPVGPDAVPFLQWRNQFSDEEWVALHGSDDKTWESRIARDFGMTESKAG